MLDICDLKVGLDAESGLVRAIDGLSLAIERGETFALVGESGCGKSMTALALMRLLPENGRITQGDITLAGQDLLALPESGMRSIRGRRIGMIFQEPSTSLSPVMRVGDQLVEAIETHTQLRGPAARERALGWLARVGIPEPERRIDDYPFRMSGGQKQRVMIAMTLACEPDFVVADEPTTALDVTIQAQILDLLKALQAEQGLGLLLITHDLAVVSGMAHRVALMYAGQIIEVASAQEFFQAPKHPYAQALLRALPDADKRGAALAAIPGTVPALTQEFPGCRFAERCDVVRTACHMTRPELIQFDARWVRCLRYEAGFDAKDDAEPSAQALPVNPQRSPSADVNALGRVGTVATYAGGANAPPSDEPILQVRNLRVEFPIRGGLLQRPRGAFVAVDGVSFDIQRGKTLALVGESGCGKTTTGKAIVQLLRRQARIEGQALLAGRDLFTMGADELRAARRAIQIIFQDPFASLNPRMRVGEILDEGVQSLRPDLADGNTRLAHLKRVVGQVGLREDALARYPHEFSGGQRQRIAIARALAVEPDILVCDEPTSALDVSVQAQILNLLKQLQRDLGVSYLFITHNIGVVEYLAEDIVVMHRGRIEETGQATDVLSAPQSAYTRTLLASVPRVVVSTALATT